MLFDEYADGRVMDFKLEDFGGGRKKNVRLIEVLSVVDKGYRESLKKEFKYEDYLEEGRKFLDAARLEADRIKSIAFDEGHKEGFAEGLRKASEEQQAKTDEFLGNLRGILGEVESFWDKMLEANQENIVRLIVETVKIVVCGEIKTNRDVIVNVIKKIFRKVRESQEIRLWINRDDLQALKNNRENILEVLGAGKKITVSADSGLKRGGCRVRTENQEIDAGIDRMVAEMEKNLLEEYLR